MVQDLIICLQEATLYFILKKSWVPKYRDQCLVNFPCGCLNPGKEIKCEDCPYLEACLSTWKLQHDHVKPRAKCSNLRE
ncbi:hypothetical protein F2Y95_11785 [Aphanizomenon flos-aquae CCAP 1446/1C]|uniref:Uncharacterized protein n=1 Tax=Anabaena cylindrica (strain ATCC 27899 / PCC 7122) TaxID=272123 RepID=K9ZI70_ANACC|nr:hypothetical protein Anacy_3048 [Anabaena cylindrica PCC 7122]MBY5282421.1 hypothetical protein [Anabaena sp. CCAP 1446/1C]MBY5308780.1 hypothetical protein [Anabaena sp. CCAP 1446/1C]BAY04540.1 hypothetical protein NIES19_38050 [Anabaena cylindrica PCC 7122]